MNNLSSTGVWNGLEDSLSSLEIAKVIYDSLINFDRDVVLNDRPFELSIRTSERGPSHLRPYASELMKCPRKAAFSRYRTWPTHPDLLVKNQPHLWTLFRGGIVGQAYIEEALAVAAADGWAPWVSIESEVRLLDDCPISGRVDVMLMETRLDGHSLPTEIKTSASTYLQEAWMWQISAYVEFMRAPIGYLVISAPTEWAVYCITREASSFESERYDPDTESFTEGPFSIREEHLYETIERNTFFLEATRPPRYVQETEPLDHTCRPHHRECVSVVSEPKRYQRKHGEYNAGDVRQGELAVSCPWAGLCFPMLMDEYTHDIDLDEHDRPVIYTPFTVKG